MEIIENYTHIYVRLFELRYYNLLLFLGSDISLDIVSH